MRRIDLGERPRSRSELARWYSAAVTAQKRSGVSVTEYARRLGVTASTLYHWRGRLSAGGGSRLRSGRRTAARPGLIEVVVDGEHAVDTIGCAVVRLGGSRSIEVPHGFDGDDLRRLVTLLESC
jgi:transposase-like protein